METVTSVEDLRLTLGDAPSQDRETMRIKVQIDFAFVVSYAAFLTLLGLLLAHRGGWRRAAGVASVLCAVAISVFDVFENLAILAVLDVPVSKSAELLMAITQPAGMKWRLILLYALLLLSHYESTSGNSVPSSLRSNPR